MNNRPKIRVELRPTDKIIETLAWSFLLASWVLVLVNYPSLPDTVATHYNGTGQADRFIAKEMIFSLPLIVTILYIGLTLLNRFPHIFNYPIKITEENALTHYTKATRLVRYLKIILVTVSLLVALKTIENAYGHPDWIGAWFLPVLVVLIFLPLPYFLLKYRKETKTIDKNL